MEILIGLSIALSAVLGGYIFSDVRSRRKIEAELASKTAQLNENLDAFSKAYAQFNERAIETDTRLTSLEFRLNSGSDSGRK